MIDHTNVIKALRAQFETAEGLPPDDRIASENVDFETPDIDRQNPENSLWIDENYLPGNEDWVANRLTEMVGIMEWSVKVPAGTSTELADSLAQNIGEVFKPSMAIGGILTVVRTDRLRGRPEDSWYRVPVRVSFRITNNFNI